MQELLDRLSASGLLDGRGDIILERYSDGGYQAVSAEVFASMFGAALDVPDLEDVYSALASADYDPATGAARGYARFFEAWREAGII